MSLSTNATFAALIVICILMPIINFDMAMYEYTNDADPPIRMISTDRKIIGYLVFKPLITMAMLFLFMTILGFVSYKLVGKSIIGFFKSFAKITAFYVSLSFIVFFLHAFYYASFPWKQMSADETKCIILNHYTMLTIVGIFLCITCRTLLMSTSSQE